MQPHLSRGKIAFRPVRDEDRAFLLALYAETRAAEFQGGLWPEADRDRFLTGQFDAQARHYRAAFPGASHTVVQCGAVDIGRLTADRQDDCLRIIDFIIAAAWRGQGIGSDILRALMHEAQGGKVPVRLLDDFQGILQADGYSGSWSGFGAASNTSVFTSPPSKTDTT